MKILITGIEGQLGKALVNSKPKDIDIFGLKRLDFDLEDFNSCRNFIKNKKPNWIINTAAFTDVNRAEFEQEKTYKVNSYGVANIVEAAASYGGNVIHLSSDFVFDGIHKNSYKPSDKCNPINTYGNSKYKAEKLIIRYPNVIILRTSWLYGPVGKNFCLSILKTCKLISKDKKPLKVVSDQIGCPTSSIDLAEACWRFTRFLSGKDYSSEIFHWCNYGIISWFDFAKAIVELGLEYGLLSEGVEIIPIKSKDYKSNAKRPLFSVLDCEKTEKLLKMHQKYWKDSLKEVIRLIKKEDI